MTIPSEEQLRLFEKEPLRYRDEVKDADKRIWEWFSNNMENGTEFNKLYEKGTQEWIDACKEEVHIMKVWTRVINLKTKINDYDNKEERKRIKAMKSGASRFRRANPVLHVANTGTFDRVSGQFDIQQMMCLFPVCGEA